MITLENDFQKLLFELEPNKMMRTFKKKAYDTSFHEYYNAHKDIYDLLSELYAKEDCDNAELARVALPLVEKAKTMVSGTSFFGRDRYLMDLNCMMAFWVMPGIVESGEEKAHALAELLVEEWTKAFPKVNLGIATFAEINEGFRQTKIFGIPVGNK